MKVFEYKVICKCTDKAFNDYMKENGQWHKEGYGVKDFANEIAEEIDDLMINNDYTVCSTDIKLISVKEDQSGDEEYDDYEEEEDEDEV